MSLSLVGRIPPPPPEVVEWMEHFGGVASEGKDEMIDRALHALRATLERPGRNREGAYALLAADGLLTYAVEDAVQASDPEAKLREIFAKVAEVL